MAEQTLNSEFPLQSEPELRRNEHEPKGVLQRNLKALIYLGAAVLVIAAAILSASGRRSKTQPSSTRHDAPQPALQDNTDTNVQDLKNQLAQERQREAQMEAEARTQQSVAALPNSQLPPSATGLAAYGASQQFAPCQPGQPCQQQYPYAPQANGYMQPQITPEKEQANQLAAKERELAYNARFASNLVFARPLAHDTGDQNALAETSGISRVQAAPQSGTNNGEKQSQLVRETDPRPAQTSPATGGHRNEVNIDAAGGQPYVIYEGLTMDTTLMNRLDGDAPGPVKVLVSSPLYSHDRQHVLIPDGTVVLGEARKIGTSGFGQQRRMAVVFHRMIMPDGYSVDLDQFHGLDQIGEEGLKDKVNNHYFEIFGTSIALGVIAGAGQIAAGGGTITTSGSQAFTTGAASSVSQSATTVLDRFIQIPPTITIREGHRVKVYFTQDMLLPAYENHTIPQAF